MLNKVLTTPLEREFEGWITWLMEDYFDSVGIEAQIWTLSQEDEASWPADEALFLDGKILGLQMKRPEMAGPLQNPQQPQRDFHRFKWDLGNNEEQFNLIKEFTEMFYCLPTFINREWKKGSLHHCIFWRPDEGESHTSTLWYENPNVVQWHGRIERHKNTHRWGGFIERVLDCEFGRLIGRAEDWVAHVATLRSKLRAARYFDKGDCLILVNIRHKRRTASATPVSPPSLPDTSP